MHRLWQHAAMHDHLVHHMGMWDACAQWQLSRPVAGSGVCVFVLGRTMRASHGRPPNAKYNKRTRTPQRPVTICAHTDHHHINQRADIISTYVHGFATCIYKYITG